MNIVSFIHPVRTFLPCSGVGRHANNMLLRLAEREGVDISLLFSAQWLEGDGTLDSRSPLCSLPFDTFPWRENWTERSWKLLGRPRMDRWVHTDADLVYSPMESYLPLRKTLCAVTIHDIQAFETDLPWSGTWQHRLFRWKWSTWIRRTLRDCVFVCTVSEFSKGRMVELLGAKPGKIKVVGNGVHDRFFAIAEKAPEALPRPCEEPYLFMIGGLREKKGAAAMLAVARELERQGSPLQLVVAGPNGPAYEAEAQTLNNVHLLGWVADADVPHLMRASLALLFLSPYEGFGLPAAEAMAAGVPAIVADAASLPEVVGEAGIVVSPQQTDAIVDRVLTLERDAALCQSYAKAGRQRAQRFTWDRCVDRLLEAFREIT